MGIIDLTVVTPNVPKNARRMHVYQMSKLNQEHSIDKNLLYYDVKSNGGMESSLNQLHNYGVAYKNEDYINFNRFYTINPADRAPSGRHYVFFCRPDLYFFEETSKGNLDLSDESGVAQDPIFRELAYKNPEILQTLTAEFDINAKDFTIGMQWPSASGFGNSKTSDGSKDMKNRPLSIHSLMPILGSRVESIQLPDYSLKSSVIQQPYTKYSIPVAGNAIESITGGSFDISFREDVNFTMTKLFYAWVYYINGVSRNVFRPKEKYSLYNALDYATSIYDIVVKEDGETIAMMSKYTGAFPVNVPVSDWAFTKGSTPPTSININFQYFYYEAFGSEIITDFNFNSLGYIYMTQHVGEDNYYVIKENDQQLPFMLTYNYGNASVDRSLVGRPYIVLDTNKKVHKLRWMPPV